MSTFDIRTFLRKIDNPDSPMLTEDEYEMRGHPMNKNAATMFVLSNGDSPMKIVFSEEDALNSGVEYIDAFDENGNLVNSLKINPNTMEYTDDF